MVRWEFSRILSSRKARLLSRVPSLNRMHSRSSAVGIPQPLWLSRGSDLRSHTFQQAAAHRWSSWQVRDCQASKCSRTRLNEKAGYSGQLEDVQDAPGDQRVL